MDTSYKAASYNIPALQRVNVTTLPSDNELQFFDRFTVISRCRNLAINNPLAKAIIDVLCSHVLGTGLRPQIYQNETLEQEFLQWCDTHEFGSAMSFDQLQEIVLRTMLISGDILVNTIVTDRNTFNVQLIEPERVVNPGFSFNTLQLRNGVEIDDAGAPIKYHVLTQHPQEPTGYQYFELDARDSQGDKKAWLIFQPVRPDQHRGIPLFSSVVDKFYLLDKYIDAEQLASVIAANFCIFIKSPGLISPLGIPQDKTTVEGNTIQQHTQIEPGMIVHLAPNEDIEPVNPTRPTTNFEPFVNAVTRQICSGVGLSAEVVQMTFNANYSASKAAMAQSWKTVMNYRKLIVKYFCNPVFNLWCKFNGYAIPKIEWQGPSRVVLDDAKEVIAATERVNLGISSRQEECEELRGKDWYITHQNLEKEMELGYGSPDLVTGVSNE